MKKLLLAIALGAMALASSAQSEQAVEDIRISAGLARIELPDELHNVWQTEFDQVAGTYRLSNGKTMQLSMWGNRMYAKVDGAPRRQLAAVTPYIFVARDLQMKIRISNVEATGPIKAELMLAEPYVAGAPSGLTYTHLIATR
jgi:opacity protein-like surface antigen